MKAQAQSEAKRIIKEKEAMEQLAKKQAEEER